MYFLILLAGFSGGVVRGLVGFIKHQYSYKKVPFNLTYFLGMSFLSGMIGLVVVAALREIGFTYQSFFTPALGFIIGYAGGDLVENVYKIIVKKSSLFPTKENTQK